MNQKITNDKEQKLVEFVERKHSPNPLKNKVLRTSLIIMKHLINCYKQYK